MAFPQIQATEQYVQDTESANHAVTLPATAQVGELLLMEFSTTNFSSSTTITITAPTGWTQIANSGFSIGGRRPRRMVCWRIADGTEGATATVTLSGNGKAIAFTHRISGHNQLKPPIAMNATGTSATPDPPSVDAQESADILWVAGAVICQAQTITAAPTNYTNLLTAGPTAGGAPGVNLATGSARRELAIQTEDPSTFGASGSSEWVATTIAVYPGGTNPPVEPEGQFPFRQQQWTQVNANSITASFRNVPTEGNLLVAALTRAAPSGLPSGYTLAGTSIGDGGHEVRLYVKRAGASEPTDVTFTFAAAGVHVLWIAEMVNVPAAGTAVSLIDQTVAANSGASSVLTLSSGTTGTTTQANEVAVCIMDLEAQIDFFESWTNDFDNLLDVDPAGRFASAYKILDSTQTVETTATWSNAGRVASLLFTVKLDAAPTIRLPRRRRKAGPNVNATTNVGGDVTTQAFAVKANRLYVVYVWASKTGEIIADSSIADSHGGGMSWTLIASHSLSNNNRIHAFRAMSASDLASGALTINAAGVASVDMWWLVEEIEGVDTSGVNGAGAIRQSKVAGQGGSGSFGLDIVFDSAPLSTSAVTGATGNGLGGGRHLLDHVYFQVANALIDRYVSAQWLDAADQTLRWEWDVQVHSLGVALELIPAAGAQNIAVGQAIEAEVGQPITPLLDRQVTISQTVEAETANPIQAVISRDVAVGQAVEAETANPITPLISRQVAVGQASESETANPITPVGAREVAVGQASESETANAITPATARTVDVGQAVERELAQAITPVIGRMVAIGQAAEVETGQPIAPVRGVAVGRASEVELARLISPVKPIFVPLQTAVERELAQIITPTKQVPGQLGPAVCVVVSPSAECETFAL